jgi:hypothetical protein
LGNLATKAALSTRDRSTAQLIKLLLRTTRLISKELLHPALRVEFAAVNTFAPNS